MLGLKNATKFRLFVLLALGFWFTYLLRKSSRDNMLFDDLILIGVGLIGIIFFTYCAWADWKNYKSNQKAGSFWLTVVGAVFIFTNLLLYYSQEARLNAPTLLSAYYDGDFNGFAVDFKRDGNYVMVDEEGVGREFFYGKYTLNGSTIILDTSEIGSFIKSNRILIVSGQKSSNENQEFSYLVQVDNRGVEIENNLKLILTRDNRGLAQ